MKSGLLNRLYRQFPALQHKNYRLYFAGQLISFTGSWLHGVAHGWLTFNLTHSAFWLGVVAAVSTLPVLFLSLIGGFLVDRFNRKKLLLFTQSFSLVLAFALGLLTITNHITLPLLLMLTFLSGVANAFDNPASQAFVVDIVKGKDLPSAIGLNSTLFNTGRVLGPAIAGFLIAIVGIGNIFFINALSFTAILVSLYFIKVTQPISSKKEAPALAIKEGLKYSIKHPLISQLLLTAAVGAIFCFSQATLMPVLAADVFLIGTQGLGLLLSSAGMGALCGSILVSSQYKKVKSSTFIMLGCIAFVASTFVFSFTKNIYVASLLLFISGLGLTIQFSSVYATIQRHVREEYRGRVSSIYVLLFVGLSPIGNLFIGSTATVLGAQMAIRICTFTIFIFGTAMYLRLGKVRGRYQAYTQKLTS